MKIKVKSKKVKDTFFTLVPLNWLLRVFNLSCIHRKENQLKVSWSPMRGIIYVLLFGFMNFFLLLTKIQRLDIIRNNTTLLKFSDAIQVSYLFGYFEYTIDMFYVFKYGRDFLLNYFKCYDRIDQILGMTYYDEIRRIIFKTVGFCYIMFVLTSVFDYASWIEGFGWISPTLYAFDYFYFFLNMLTVLDAWSHIIQLEYRLKLMKDILQGYYNSPNSTRSISDDYNKTWALRTETGNIGLESLKTLSYDRFIEVIGFNRCYLLLLEQANYFNKMFGFRLLIFCLDLLMNMIDLLNVAIRIATESMISPYGPSRLPSIFSIMRLMNWVTVAIIMVHRCERTYRQSERILETIDLLLVNKKNSANLTTTLVNFRNLLITRPIKFHAIRFFTIEYTILVSISSTVVTYTIILLQNMQS